MHRAGYQTVRVAAFYHQYAVVHGIGGLLRRFLLGHALGLAQLVQKMRVFGGLFALRRIDYLDAVELRAGLGGDGPDLFGVAQHGQARDALLNYLRGRLNVSFLVSLGQHDVLYVALRLRLDNVYNSHVIHPPNLRVNA